MAKTLEFDKRLPGWLNALLNKAPFCLDTESIKSVAFAVDNEGPYFPGTKSLFYNGYFMIRLVWPFGVFVHIKVSADRRTQFGIGWKLNGRFAITLRPWQTDANAAKGVQGPNYGQASAWNRGTA